MKQLSLLLVAGLAGCTNIPVGSVKEYHRTTSVLGVTSEATMSGIKSTQKTVEVDNATFTLTFPGFTHTQTVKGLTLPNPEK